MSPFRRGSRHLRSQRNWNRLQNRHSLHAEQLEDRLLLAISAGDISDQFDDLRTALEAVDISHVTVVTHGFQTGDDAEDDGDALEPLALAIHQRNVLRDFPNTSFSPAWYLDYDLDGDNEVAFVDTAESILPSGNEIGKPSGPLVILFDWAAETNESSAGWGEGAGDALFNLLVGLDLVLPAAGTTRNDIAFHFIAHSYGTAATSEAIERLAAYEVPVDHVTYLDPHDFDLGIIDIFDIAGSTETEQRLWSLGRPHNTVGASQRQSPDTYGTAVWNNVDFADNYYQTRGTAQVDNPLPPPAFLPLSDAFIPLGRPIPGAYNVLINDQLDPNIASPALGGGGDHTYAWSCFYQSTVEGSLADDCTTPLTSPDGYGYSLLGLGPPRPNPTFFHTTQANQDHEYSSPLLVNTTTGQPSISLPLTAQEVTSGRWDPEWSPLEDAIYNGDFVFAGDSTFTDEIPGWSHHGGGGTGEWESDNGNGYLRLDHDDSHRTHNAFHIPSAAGHLQFDLWVQDKSDDGDRLIIKLGETELGSLKLDFLTSGFVTQTATALLPAYLDAPVDTLTFSLRGGGAGIDSIVGIDNVKLRPLTETSPKSFLKELGRFHDLLFDFVEPSTENQGRGSGLHDATPNELLQLPLASQQAGDVVDTASLFSEVEARLNGSMELAAGNTPTSLQLSPISIVLGSAGPPGYNDFLVGPGQPPISAMVVSTAPVVSWMAIPADPFSGGIHAGTGPLIQFTPSPSRPNLGGKQSLPPIGYYLHVSTTAGSASSFIQQNPIANLQQEYIDFGYTTIPSVAVGDPVFGKFSNFFPYLIDQGGDDLLDDLRDIYTGEIDLKKGYANPQRNRPLGRPFETSHELGTAVDVVPRRRDLASTVSLYHAALDLNPGTVRLAADHDEPLLPDNWRPPGATHTFFVGSTSIVAGDTDEQPDGLPDIVLSITNAPSGGLPESTLLSYVGGSGDNPDFRIAGDGDVIEVGEPLVLVHQPADVPGFAAESPLALYFEEASHVHADTGFTVSGQHAASGGSFSPLDTPQPGFDPNDAHLMVTIDGLDPLHVLLPATTTADNTTVADLADDLDGALHQAGLEKVLTAVATHDGRVALQTVAAAGIGSLSVSTLRMEADNLGPANGKTSAPLDPVAGPDQFTLEITRSLPDSNGVLQTAVTTYGVQLGTTPPGAEDDPFAYTQDNANVAELADDLNLAMLEAGLGEVVALVSVGMNGQVDFNPLGQTSGVDDKLILAATDPSVTGIKVLATGAGLELGFSNNQAVDENTNTNTAATILGFTGQRLVRDTTGETISTQLDKLEDVLREMSAAAGLPLPTSYDINPQVDTVNNIITFNLQLNHVFEKPIELDFFDDEVDLGSFGLLEVAALADAKLTATVMFDYEAGIDLSGPGSNFTLTESTFLSDLNGGDGVQLSVGMTAPQVAPASGQPGVDVGFFMAVETATGVTSYSVSVPQADTSDNLDAQMLADDVNAALAAAGIGTIVQAGVHTRQEEDQHGHILLTEQRLLLRGIGESVRSLAISGTSLTDLGFATSQQSDYADLIIGIGTSPPVEVNLDGASTVGDVIGAIEGATANAVDVSIDSGTDGLRLTASANLTVIRSFEPTHEIDNVANNVLDRAEDGFRSLAGTGLGILGAPDPQLTAAENQVIEGEPLHGVTLRDSIFIVPRDSHAPGNDISVRLGLEVDDVDVSAALGTISFDLRGNDAAKISPADPDIGLGITVGTDFKDPGTQAHDGRLYLSEPFNSPADVLVLTPSNFDLDVDGAAHLGLALNFDSDAEDFLSAIAGDTDPFFTVDVVANTVTKDFDFQVDADFNLLLDELEDVDTDTILQVIRAVVGLLQDNQDVPLFNKEIPLLNRSVNDLVSFADSLLDAAENVLVNPDIDAVVVAIDDVETAVVNLSTSLDERARMFRAVEMLRRVIGHQDDLDDNGNSRLPARLLSAVRQLAKAIYFEVELLPASEQPDGTQKLIDARDGLIELVPSLNSVEKRLSSAIERSLRRGLGIPVDDESVHFEFDMGIADDLTGDGDVSKTDRAIVAGFHLADNSLLAESFEPNMPASNLFGAIEIQTDPNQPPSMLHLGGGIGLGFAYDLTPGVTNRAMVLVDPPVEFDDIVLHKTEVDLNIGFEGELQPQIRFGQLSLLSGAVDLSLLKAEIARFTVPFNLNSSTGNYASLSISPKPTTGEDERFAIVAIYPSDGSPAEVLSLGEYEIQDHGSTADLVISGDVDLSAVGEVTIEYHSAATEAAAVDPADVAHRAAVNLSFEPSATPANPLGAVPVSSFSADTTERIDAYQRDNLGVPQQGSLVVGSADATFLNSTEDDIVTVAASLQHLLQPQVNYDEEALNRLFANVDFDLKTIVAGIDALLQTIENGLTEEVIAQLPVVGGGLNTAGTFIGDLRQTLVVPFFDFLCTLEGTFDEAANDVASFIFAQFAAIGLDAALEDLDNSTTANPGDIQVEIDRDHFEIYFSLTGGDTQIVDFDSGLSGLPIDAEGQGGVEFGWMYDVDFGVGVDRFDGFYFVVDGAEPEITLDIGAHLLVDGTTQPEIPTSLSVNFLGLQLSASDINNGPNPGTEITGMLELDAADTRPTDGLDRLYFSDIAASPFGEIFSAEMSAMVAVMLHLEAGINDTLPSVQSDLMLSWKAQLSTDNGSIMVFSEDLVFALKDIGIDLGDFLSRHVGAAIRQINKFLQPIEPLIKFLKQEVPGVTQLSEAAGRGPVTFLDLAASQIPHQAENARKFVDALDTLIELRDSLGVLDNDTVVFVLKDLLEILDGSDDNQADALAGNADFAQAVDVDAEIAADGGQDVDPMTASGGKIQGLIKKLSDLGIELHFLDVGTIVKMLLGQPFDVISYDFPRLELPFSWEKSFRVIPFPPISIRLGLDADVFADLSVGYDSHGLDTGRFFDGFYFGDRENVFLGADIDEFGLGVGVRLAALLDLVIASAGVEGELRGDILANWRDLDDNGKVHLDEMTSIVRADGFACLFDLHGELRAIVRAIWEINYLVGTETGSKEFINEIIFSFEHECPAYELGHVSPGGESLPGAPQATSQAGTLILHAGAFAGERQPGSSSDVAESFEVQQLAPGVFQVNALGLESRYDGVTQIYFDGGRGDDVLILQDVDVPVIALGGADDDILYGTRHTDYLDGGGGNDQLFARGGTDDVFGGSGNDLIYGDLAPDDSNPIWGTGAADTIDGGAGHDNIFGAEGNDVVAGGAGNDTIMVDVGADTVHAGSGNDIVFGGDDNDIIFGQDGADQLFGEAGADDMDGGTGPDLVMGHRGDDVLRGGSQIDVLIGGLGADDLFGEHGNDLIAGGLATENADLKAVVMEVLQDNALVAVIETQEAGDFGSLDSGDEVWGGTDNDFLIGDGGPDQLFGGWGDDVILVHQLHDHSISNVTASDVEYVEGGPDDDFICGADSVDEIYGGTADMGLAHILATQGSTPTLGGYTLTSCVNGVVNVEEPPTTSSIRGVKFNDADGNGEFDVGESLLAGWTILLLDRNGSTIASTQTDGTGTYAFTGLAPGDYQVVEEQQTDWVQTAAPYTQTLLVDQAVTDLNFGNQFAGGTITGQKWHDVNGDGVRDTSTEQGLNGWQILLIDESGELFESTVTADVDLDNNGQIDLLTERGVYQFTNIPSGEYSLQEVPQAGWIQTSPKLADSDVFAPIADDGYTQTRSDVFVSGMSGLITDVNVSLNIEHSRRNDLEVFLISPSGTRIDLFQLVGGQHEDLAAITLDDSAPDLMDDITSVQDTNPAITTFRPQGLLAVLKGEDPKGLWTLSITDSREEEAGRLLDWSLPIATDAPQTASLDGGAPSPLAPGRSLAYAVSIASGDSLTHDFGNYRTASVEGLKFLDTNANGRRDLEGPAGSEPGLAGVTIYADLNNNLQHDRGEPSAFTLADNPNTDIDETGTYRLAPLAPGRYVIREVAEAVLQQTFPSQRAGQDVTMASGETLVAVDFGNSPPASVHGTKWLDENGSGVRDDGEPGISNVVIYADLNNNAIKDDGEPATVTMASASVISLPGDYDGDDNVSAADYTVWRNTLGSSADLAADGNASGMVDRDDYRIWSANFGRRLALEPGMVNQSGHYWLEVPAGDVIIREVLVTGMATTFPLTGFHQLQLDPVEVREGIDFGNRPAEIIEEGSVAGKKVFDENANGMPDEVDIPQQGVTIYVDINGNGTHEIATEPSDVTKADGSYLIPGVPVGTWNVREVVPVGFSQVFPAAGFHQVTVNAGQAVTGVDFANGPEQIEEGSISGAKVFDKNSHGMQNDPGQLGTIHGHKFEDLNGNGLWDADELPLAGWTIEITGGDFNGDGLIDAADRLTTITNAMGEYWFMDLPPNVLYTVSEQLQPGWTQTSTGGMGIAGMLNPIPGTTNWVIELLAGEMYFDVDFGNQRQMGDLGSVHGQKWHDRNANAVRDAGEEGLDGWEIELFDSQGDVIATTTTMSMDLDGDNVIDPHTEQGLIWFDDVAPGSYQVGEVLQAGWRQTVPDVMNIRQPGDANQDGRYDEADLMQVLAWDLSGSGAPAGWFQGDFNNDGVVDQKDEDLADATGNYNQDPYFGAEARRIDVMLAPGQDLGGLEFANYMPVPLPDGDDLIFAAAADDVIRGDNLVADPAVISVGTRSDTIRGQAGRDRIFGQEEDDILWGADESLGVVAPNADDDFIVGGLGLDEVRQSVDVDQNLTNSILTGQGPDQLISLERATLTGGASSNVIDASAFSGPVALFGKGGDDVLTGGASHDVLDGGAGSDDMAGGDGDDRYSFRPVPAGPVEHDTVAELPGQGMDELDFSALDTPIEVDLTNALFAQQPGTNNVREIRSQSAGQEANLENIIGTEFDDSIVGNVANNEILALGGTDNVAAGGGDDLIDLGVGLNETADGNSGNDRLVFRDDWGSATITDGGDEDTLDFSAVTLPLNFFIGSLEVTDGTNTVSNSISQFEHLIGGQADDAFVFDDGAMLPSGGSIDGQSGTDTLDYSAYTSGVNVNLSNGNATGVPLVGGAQRIENVTGGQADDAITGDNGPNRLQGLAGADSIHGLGNDDIIEGGEGADLLLNGGGGNDQIFGGPGNDGAFGIVGGLGDDLLVGGPGNDSNIDGGFGSDTYRIADGDGSDSLSDTGAAADIDVLDLTQVSTALQVNIQSGSIKVNFLATSDQLTSTATLEHLLAGQGDDTFSFHGTEALPGASKVDAGGGANTIDFAAYGSAVHVNLSSADFNAPLVAARTVKASGGMTIVEQIANFRHVLGSDFDDLLIGDDQHNQLSGGAGDDKLFGGPGHDRLLGGAGDNESAGGDDNDTYVLFPVLGNVTLIENQGTVSVGQASNGGVDTIDLSLFAIAVGLDISASDVFENIIGSPTHRNMLTGNALDNLLIGGNASDILLGGGGDDFLIGQGHDDWLEGGDGSDILLGGAGDDGKGIDVSSNPRRFLGGAGRDLVIGGSGEDVINANDNEEDLVITGLTDYENAHNDPMHRQAWREILSVWQSPRSRSQRERLITTGVGPNGQFQLVYGTAGTIHDDTVLDFLSFDTIATGSPVDDFVFDDAGDTAIAQALPSMATSSVPDSGRSVVVFSAWPSRGWLLRRDQVFSQFAAGQPTEVDSLALQLFSIHHQRRLRRADRMVFLPIDHHETNAHNQLLEPIDDYFQQLGVASDF